MDISYITIFFYLLGTEINSVFLIYVLLVIFGIGSLVNIFAADTDSHFAYHYFSETNNYIVPAVIFLFIGVGLGMFWLSMWFGHIFLNGKLPVSSAEFRLVASLDLIIIVNLMILSGVSLIRKKNLGFITGSIIGIQGCLYLLILTVNSIHLSIKQQSYSNELPIWLILLLICIVGTAALFVIGRKKLPISVTKNSNYKRQDLRT